MIDRICLRQLEASDFGAMHKIVPRQLKTTQQK